ncbi:MULTISPECIES: plasmid stabilization protein [unclassified Rhizobium]|uniref:plasmid stabilization protein n=1 Tax=unclassified Rhizobium TaxID=2613769 RepID=UPI001A99B919|nr:MULTISPECIES: plasmid stabilization protein [unclassified Rhizobium]MBX5156731.1 plasmid stabilization protein [Rhizobium sp. NZLR8]MBX5181941.1 plasmid stabilization protein [Rhizobium sp. NZLR5]MBX5187716.1 plasmid stabilization protein [Rhizobium sp. NZLR3b]MBX5194096.1 plasmid stabilization protein [Rhizobium sp. NZLR10]MBX5200016.1 plasmid stabilization protein [Rhizobium sp. NZLR1]
MTEPQLAVRSAKARDLARRLARRENRSVAEIVERALEHYEICQVGPEPAMSVYARLSPQSGADLDLEAVVDGSREIHKGIEV